MLAPSPPRLAPCSTAWPVSPASRSALSAEARSRGVAVRSVAHRLSTPREADRVVSLEAGEIVEQGSPKELVPAGGRFAARLELDDAGWEWRTPEGRRLKEAGMVVRDRDRYSQPDAPDPVLDTDVVLSLVRRHVPGASALTGIDETGGEARVYEIDDDVVLKTQRPHRARERTGPG